METLSVGDCYKLVGSQHPNSPANRWGHPMYLIDDAPPNRHGRKTVRLIDGETFEEFFAEPKRLRPFDDAEFDSLPKDAATLSVESEVEPYLLRDDITAAFEAAELTERERKVIMLRCGLYDGHGYLLRDVGEFLGLSMERARQLEGKGLHKIRTNRKARKLLYSYCRD